jgi:hypothetical protein
VGPRQHHISSARRFYSYTQTGRQARRTQGRRMSPFYANSPRERWTMAAVKIPIEILRLFVQTGNVQCQVELILAIYCKLSIQKTKIQSKALRMIVDAPWYLPNTIIRRDLQTPTAEEEIRRYISQYSASFSAHPNDLILNFTELSDNRQLRRHLPNKLPTSFLV